METALRIRLERDGTRSDSREIDIPVIDARLRRALGRFEETRKLCLQITDDLENFADRALAEASFRLTDEQRQPDAVSPGEIVRDVVQKLAATEASHVLAVLKDLARDLTATLQATADDLGFDDVHKQDDLTSALKEMPRPDIGAWNINARPGFMARLSKRMAARRIEHRLRAQIGTALSRRFYNFGRMLDAWAQRVLADLQHRFDAHADGYRAHLHRVSAIDRLSEAEAVSIRRDLKRLARPQTSNAAERIPAS